MTIAADLRALATEARRLSEAVDRARDMLTALDVQLEALAQRAGAPRRRAQPNVPCRVCNGAGWAWAHELRHYYGDNPSADDTRYTCDWCRKRRDYAASTARWRTLGPRDWRVLSGRSEPWSLERVRRVRPGRYSRGHER